MFCQMPDYISIPNKDGDYEQTPVITVTPATLTVDSVPKLGPPTPPITPTTPKPILKTRKSTTPLSTYQLPSTHSTI